jgi:hypothetical protein
MILHPDFRERLYWVFRRITRVKVLFYKRSFSVLSGKVTKILEFLGWAL